MNKLNTKKGFTIIEVVLVLAIAGLIFLMVFVALPRLQSSQRDTQRRDDVAAVATAITQYQSNNGGRMPNDSSTNATTFIQSYLQSGGATFNVPNSNEGYTLLIKTSTGTGSSSIASLSSAGATTTTIVIVKGVRCGDDGNLVPGSTRDYVVGMQLEGSGYYCTNN